MLRSQVESYTPQFVKLGASRYGSTCWPVRLFNPIVGVGFGAPQLLWSTDASGADIASYEDVDLSKADGFVYRTFEIEGSEKQIRCLADYADVRTFSRFHVHTEMGALGVRKSFSTRKDFENDGAFQTSVRKQLDRYGLKAPFDEQGVVSSDWYNLLRGLPLEEMGMSTNLLRANVPAVDGPKMCRLSLKDFLKDHPFGADEPLVADWDYGPEGLKETCEDMGGDAAAEMCARYGGPPARDPYHVDFKLNPLWILKHKPWPRFGSPDGNWYKDTLDGQLKGTRDLWKVA